MYDSRFDHFLRTTSTVVVVVDGVGIQAPPTDDVLNRNNQPWIALHWVKAAFAAKIVAHTYLLIIDNSSNHSSKLDDKTGFVRFPASPLIYPIGESTTGP